MTDERCALCWEPDMALFWWEELKICEWCFDDTTEMGIDRVLAHPEDDACPTGRGRKDK